MKNEREIRSHWYWVLELKLRVAQIFGWYQLSVIYYAPVVGQNYSDYAVLIGRRYGKR